MLILMLLNFNTGYADTGADLCIRIMSLWCTVKNIEDGAHRQVELCQQATLLLTLVLIISTCI